MKNLYTNIKFQKKGEKVVKNNCEKYFMQTKQEINENLENLIKKKTFYQEVFLKTDSLYERLKEYDVSPSFQSKDIQTLQDFLKKEKVEQWKIKFEKIQSRF